MKIGFTITISEVFEKKIRFQADRSDGMAHAGEYPRDMSMGLALDLFVSEARVAFKRYDDQQDKLKLDYAKEQNTCRGCDGTGRSNTGRGQCFTCDGKGKL